MVDQAPKDSDEKAITESTQKLTIVGRIVR